MSNTLVPLLADTAMWAGLPLSLWITFRICRYPDLAIEQWFAFGGAFYGFCTINQHGKLSWTVGTCILAMGAGLICSFLKNKVRIHPIILSLAASYIVYSWTLALLGAPNLSFLKFASAPTTSRVLGWGSVTYVAMVLALWCLLRTRLGLRVLATGSNLGLARRHGLGAQAIQAGTLGLGFWVAMVAGALSSWRTVNCDVTYGSGLLVYSLSCVVLARSIHSRPSVFRAGMLLLVIGFAYNLMLQIAQQVGMPAHWTRGATGVFLLLAVSLAPSDDGKAGQWL